MTNSSTPTVKSSTKRAAPCLATIDAFTKAPTVAAVEAYEALREARLKATILRSLVDTLMAQLLEKLQFRPAPELQYLSPKTEVVLQRKDIYLLSQANMSVIDAETSSLYPREGIAPIVAGNCPALEAERDAYLAEVALLNVMAPVTGFTDSDVANMHKQRTELVALCIRLIDSSKRKPASPRRTPNVIGPGLRPAPKAMSLLDLVYEAVNDINLGNKGYSDIGNRLPVINAVRACGFTVVNTRDLHGNPVHRGYTAAGAKVWGVASEPARTRPSSQLLNSSDSPDYEGAILSSASRHLF